MSDSVDMVAALGGETITYTPHGASPKSLVAIVVRQPLRPLDRAGDVAARGSLMNAIELYIPKDAAKGLTTVRERLDKVSLKLHVHDDAPTVFTVVRIMEEDTGLVASDGGLYHLEAVA